MYYAVVDILEGRRLSHNACYEHAHLLKAGISEQGYGSSSKPGPPVPIATSETVRRGGGVRQSTHRPGFCYSHSRIPRRSEHVVSAVAHREVEEHLHVSR